MDVHEAISRRRSIRRFKETAVPYEVLEKCVDAARLAPSAMNSQMGEYVVIDDARLLPQVLNTVSKWAGVSRPQQGWSLEGRPGAYIVTLINTTLERARGAGRRNADFDAALAVENMVLAAEEQGLGSCIITSFGPQNLRQVLNIPAEYDIAILLALGYPDGKPLVETDDASVKRWRDEKDVLHVPKRSLAGVLHRNRFV